MLDMRFRGKRTDNGEWIYGYLIGKDVIVGKIVEWDNEYFCTEFWLKVDPETVGQYTGLNDKNGKEIFESDIVEHPATMGHVIFEDGMFTLSSSAKVNFGHRQPLCYIDTSECEVIGNIFENAELLKS